MRLKLSYLIVLQFTLFSCVKFDEEIPIEYRNQLNHYSLNDTIYYKSNLKDLDTIIVNNIDSSEVKINSPSNIPNKSISINIKHLPLNNWSFGKVKQNDSIKNQSLITVFKEMNYNHNDYYCNISYRDFSGLLNFKKLKEIGIDTIKTERGFLKDSLKLGSVIEVYWSIDSGMIGYKKNDGQIYKIVQ